MEQRPWATNSFPAVQ